MLKDIIFDAKIVLILTIIVIRPNLSTRKKRIKFTSMQQRKHKEKKNYNTTHSKMEKRTILLVDDSAYSIDLMKRFLLSSKGMFRKITATNGSDACVLAEKHKPDLILMDWDLPDIDGLEAMKLIKSKDSTRNIPVIIVTGVMLSPMEQEEAFEAGANDYLRKPFSKEELISRVKYVIKQSQIIKELSRPSYELLKENEMLKEQQKQYVDFQQEVVSANSFTAKSLTQIQKVIENLSDKVGKENFEEASEIITNLKENSQLAKQLLERWQSKPEQAIR